MKLKIKKLHPDAVVPTYGTDGAACFDIYSIDEGTAGSSFFPLLLRTGLAFEVPPGWVMLVHSRSGDGFKRSTRLSNCTGIIDSDYRGELLISLRNDSQSSHFFNKGDRVAQAMLMPVTSIEFDVVNELGDTARGEGGFGSTGA